MHNKIIQVIDKPVEPDLSISKKSVKKIGSEKLSDKLYNFMLDPDLLRQAELVHNGVHPGYLASYPNGMIRAITDTNVLGIWEYSLALSDGKPEDVIKNLNSLLQMVKTKNYELPLNTSRLILALLRGAIKNKDDQNTLFEYLQMFKKAIAGNSSDVRSILKKLNLIELPEGVPLKDITNNAWDDRLYDSYSSGNKSTLDLMLESYIKGLSAITITHINSLNLDGVRIALEAAKILNIDVTFAVEFNLRNNNVNENYLAYLPRLNTAEEYSEFFKSKKLELFRVFLESEKLAKNALCYELLDHFNEKHLGRLNPAFTSMSDHLKVTPLTKEELDDFANGNSLTRIHLGVVLEKKYRAALMDRLSFLKDKRPELKAQYKKGLITEKIIEKNEELISKTVKDYSELNVSKLISKYFRGNGHNFVDTKLIRQLNVFDSLNKSGIELVLARVLVEGVENTILSFMKNHTALAGLEIYNNRLYNKMDNSGLVDLMKFANAVNTNDKQAIEEIVRRNVKSIDNNELTKIITRFCQEIVDNDTTIKFTFGSDVNGYSSDNQPGIGFVKSTKATATGKPNAGIEDVIPVQFYPHTAKQIPWTSEKLGFNFQSGLNYLTVNSLRSDLLSSTASTEYGVEEIKRVARMANPEARTELDRSLDNPLNSIKNIWHYPNPIIRNLTLPSVGFGVAMSFLPLSVGLGFTMLWFGITLARNIVADMAAADDLGRLTGHKSGPWSLKNFKPDNAANDLFFTGFSIPLLKLANMALDSVLGADVLASAVKFFALCLVNGTYIYSHSKLRGLPDRTANLNFFRSLIASAPATAIDTLLLHGLLPKPVLMKICSDSVAGVIEGRGKYIRYREDRLSDFSNLVEIFSNTKDEKEKTIAVLDLMYIKAMMPRGESTITQSLKKSDEKLIRDLLLVANHPDLFSVLDEPSLAPEYKEVKQILIKELPAFKAVLHNVLKPKLGK